MSHRALVFSLVVVKLGAAGVLVSAQSQQQEVSLRPSLLFGNDPAPLVSSHPPLQPVMAVLVLQQWVERMLEMKLICGRTRRRRSWMQVSVITRQSVQQRY